MFDVLIIGSGAAGLTAAINAKQNGSSVAILSKTYPTHSQTVQAQGGINAVLYEDDDSVDIHVSDTYKASCSLANKENINFMCRNAKETILWLDKIGVPFTRNENSKIAQRKFGGTKKIRTCYSSDYTGLKIVHTLFDQCIKNDIVFINEHIMLDLIIEENVCSGVIALDIIEGKVKEFKAKSIILACGGYAGIYTNFTTNSFSNTADGLAISLNSGVNLSNIEFVQFHPTALVDSNILISESARGEGGYLLDQNGKRFIDELKSRDEVARAIYKKIKSNEKVYLDLRHLGLEKINRIMPQERRLALEFSKVKIEEELLPINPAAHYSMGGVKTDINTKTNINSLYACGEVAETSIHGANRLGGNSLLEIVTFGKVAGINASNNAKDIKCKEDKESDEFHKQKNYIKEIYSYTNKINFYECKEYIGKLFFNNVGLFRNEENLEFAINELKEIKNKIPMMGILDKSIEYNKNLVEFLEFLNMIEIAEVIAKSAQNRKESRGAHYRNDYPNESKSYQKNSLIKKIDNKLVLSFEDVL
jgi:succinate dehydrogenase / fumarate reductase, flavoprotein subunit